MDTTEYTELRTLDKLPAFLEYFSRGEGGKAGDLRRASKQNGSPHTLIVTAAGLRAADITRYLSFSLSREPVSDCWKISSDLPISRCDSRKALCEAHQDLGVHRFTEEEEVSLFLSVSLGYVFPCSNSSTAESILVSVLLLGWSIFWRPVSEPALPRIQGIYTNCLRRDALKVDSLERVLVDASHVDVKKRGILDMRETLTPLIDLLNRAELKARYMSQEKRIQLLIYWALLYYQLGDTARCQPAELSQTYRECNQNSIATTAP